ncbi:MAG TPA: DUF1707 domain-containing protein [Actinocrinis sp.]|nr:DUF1707 domain-containing protein [Actinocrinis sp.]
MADNSNTGDSLALRASDSDRERVADRLREAAAQGQITLDELEERLEATYSAKTFGELAPVTADLPALTDTAAGPAPAGRAAPIRVGAAPGRWRRSIAIMGGSSRKGPWVVPAKYHAVAVMGGIELDLREASFAEQVTVIQVGVLMGGVDIKVPEGVEVHVDAVAIMGGTDSADDHAETYASSGGPVVRITGLVVMGGVSVSRKPLKKKKRQGELTDGDGRQLEQ